MVKHILLCDDEIHIVRAAEHKFKKAGFEVRCASDGEEAWMLIQEFCPDILITDCQMPRVNGLELSERIHNDSGLAGLPVIMLSAKGYELPPNELKTRYGIRMVIPKPFSPRDLLKKVEEILAEKNDKQPAKELQLNNPTDN